MAKLTIDGYFYSEYKKINSNFDPDTFVKAEETITNLNENCTTSDHPGMLLGKVQSGKTRTFISALALAFDNGFDIAVVFTKSSKALSEQTYKRLSDEFKPFSNDGNVEIYDIINAPNTFGKWELTSKLVFIVKKETNNLNRLTNLFANSCPDIGKKRVLVIDDEADAASIGFSRAAKGYNAAKISAQISEFRRTISDCSFLQVTATPYSLYLQPKFIEVNNVKEFMPTRPAFTTLAPVPSSYVGGDTYFGDNALNATNTIESHIFYAVDPEELEKLKKEDRRSFKIEDVLTTKAISGLRYAIMCFIVGGSIQRLNGIAKGMNNRKLLFSFLLHSEFAQNSHQWQVKVVTALRDSFTDALNAKNPVILGLIADVYDDLSQSLLIESNELPTIDQVLQEVKTALNEQYLTITKVNSEENVISLLDDSGQLKLRSPLSIFIGGQVIDRGITLANLIGFYYGRRPIKAQQDTVLQHSRMYGYRRSDLAVTRFYTSNDIYHRMCQMEEFDATLRTSIESGGNQGIQFIGKDTHGDIVPCNPNKIALSDVVTIRPNKRIVPFGFQTGYATGSSGILPTICKIDSIIQENGGHDSNAPYIISLEAAIELLELIQGTLHFESNLDKTSFWSTAIARLTYLCSQQENKDDQGKVWLWAASNRNASRYVDERSHGTFNSAPDSQRESALAKEYAFNQPILFLLKQNGTEEQKWRGTPFYWPVIRAQRNVKCAIYTPVITPDDLDLAA